MKTDKTITIRTTSEMAERFHSLCKKNGTTAGHLFSTLIKKNGTDAAPIPQIAQQPIAALENAMGGVLDLVVSLSRQVEELGQEKKELKKKIDSFYKEVASQKAIIASLTELKKIKES